MNSISLQTTSLSYHEGVVTLTEEGKLPIPFALSNIWVNKQPASCLKGFDIRKITHHKVKNAAELHLSTADEPKIHLTFCDEEGNKLFERQVSPFLTGGGLRLIIERKLKLQDFVISENPTVQFQLDEALTLEESGIDAPTTLTLGKEKSASQEKKISTSITEGGSTGGVAHKSFVNFLFPFEVPVDDTAPKWRKVKEGFNLEGRCLSAQCDAFKQKRWVCIPIGFSHDEAHRINEVCCGRICPSCEKPLNPKEIKNCIFYQCAYEIDGMTSKNVPLKRNLQTEQGRPISFLLENPENGLSNLEDWIYLKIITKPIRPPSSPVQKVFYPCLIS